MDPVRQPAVAGLFYPRDPAALAAAVRGYLAGAGAVPGAACPRALVVPHAGYVYSAPVAAEAYALLAPWRGRITRVVLLGPSHRVPFRGIATSSATHWRTPLGDVRLDTAAAQALAERFPGVRVHDAAHAGEHSLEVQLPFLQEALGDIRLLPLLVGDAGAAEVAALLEPFHDDPATLVVVSSDLSHYLDDARARRTDAATCVAIEQLAGDHIGGDDACGFQPLRGLLLAARRHRLHPRTLRLANSGDTAGDRTRVVGYGAWAFYAEAA